jgi:Zn-finger nucleic acid-binding protein
LIFKEKFMKCPIDQADLVMSERQGIEIDYCPTCRGVWLDRGELDKLIDRAAPPVPQARAEAPRRDERYDDRDRYDDRRRHDDRYAGKPHKKKRESFLSDIFDF